jgi:hypothetical protein
MNEAPPSTKLREAIGAAGLDWIVPDWDVPGDVCALSTTRNGGVSGGARATLNLGRSVGDDVEAVAENRRRLGRFLPAPPVWLHQVHGVDVATLTAATGEPAPRADAAVTRERGVVCAVSTADCLPVLFADRHGSAVGIAHAGWRGLSSGVLEATIEAMGDLGSRPRISSPGSGRRSGLRASRSAPTSGIASVQRTTTRRSRSRRTFRASGSPTFTASRVRASRGAEFGI